MMDYKFRGFDAMGRKGWVYGDLVHNQKVTVTGLEPRVMVGGYEVVPESVGLCSGLKDKKGGEIFVGDIILIYDKEDDSCNNYEVLFRHGVIGVDNGSEYLSQLSMFVHIYHGEQIEDEEYEIEIIGNVIEGISV